MYVKKDLPLIIKFFVMLLSMFDCLYFWFYQGGVFLGYQKEVKLFSGIYMVWTGFEILVINPTRYLQGIYRIFTGFPKIFTGYSHGIYMVWTGFEISVINPTWYLQGIYRIFTELPEIYIVCKTTISM